MTAKGRIGRFIDQLLHEDLEALAFFLERLDAEGDPVVRAFLRASLLEPEDLSTRDEELIREGEAVLAAGRVASHDAVRREFLPYR